MKCMRAHMTGDEYAHWVARDELRSEAIERARAQAKNEAHPQIRSRSFRHRPRVRR